MTPLASTLATRARTGDQTIVLHSVSWDEYSALLETIGNSAGIRTAYLEGELEIMSPGETHEHKKKLIARLVEAYADANELDLHGFGSMTCRRQKEEAGLEPDECYILGGPKKHPDLAIEIGITSHAVDKLEIYRRLGVAEVWSWETGRIAIFSLKDGTYVRRDRSRVLPGLDMKVVEEIVRRTGPFEQAQAVRKFRASLLAPRKGRRPRRRAR